VSFNPIKKKLIKSLQFNVNLVSNLNIFFGEYCEMRNNKLFICEKPSCAKLYQFLLNKGDLIIVACGTGSYKFDYEDVSFLKSPYISRKPKYRINLEKNRTPLTVKSWDSKTGFKNDLLSDLVELHNSDKFRKQEIDLITNDFLKDFDEIIFACDPDITGVRAFCFKFEKFFNIGIDWKKKLFKKGIRVTALICYSGNQESLLRSYNERKEINISKKFKYLEENYIKKDFFEYNYNLNAILFFKNHIDLPEHLSGEFDCVLTKNHISTLFLVRSMAGISDDNLNHLMNENKIGSPVSRSVIIENLLKIGLVKEISDSKSGRIYCKYKLTSAGEVFLNNLHKKVNDPYLINVLYKDISNKSISDFKIKYKKYLYEVFSRQKKLIEIKS